MLQRSVLAEHYGARNWSRRLCATCLADTDATPLAALSVPGAVILGPTNIPDPEPCDTHGNNGECYDEPKAIPTEADGMTP